jgi:Uma2 family endonuclease
MATKTRVSLDEFLAMELSEPELELMDGEAVQKPTAGKKHSQISVELIFRLQGFLRGTGVGDVDTELRHMEREQEWVFLPDISVTLRERLAGVSFADNRPVEVLPDFAIEVLSPDDRPGRLSRKIAHYMEAGVRVLWVIDPEVEEITVWEPGAHPRLVIAGQDLSAAPVLPGFTVNREELFGRVRET